MGNNLQTNKAERDRNYSKKIFTYIGLQTKLSFKPAIPQKLWKRVLTWIVVAVVFAIFLTIAYFFLKSLVTQSTKLPPESVCILIYTIAQIVILVFGITSQITRLYQPNDLSIITAFPLTSFQRYLGEVISIYLKLEIFTILIFWPIMIVYGCAGNMFTVQFAFSSLFATILLPLMPFGVSMILAVPFMFLSSALKDKNIVKLILFVILFCGILVLYGFLLHLMSEWYIHSQTTKEVIEGIAAFVGALNHPYNPCFFLSEVCLIHDFGPNFGIYFAICIAAIAIGVGITIPLYKKFTSSAKNLEIAAKPRQTKMTDYSPFKAIFVKEFKQILRTPTYAYFYLGVAASMPILTYFIVDIVQKMGESSVGLGAFFGFTLLTILIILSLIGSFSANTIAREGQEFYITKITPVPYRTQLLAKMLVNFIVSGAGLVLCMIVIGCTCLNSDPALATLTPTGFVMLFFIALVFLVGITFNGINLSLSRPKVQMHNGRTNESNIVIQLVIGAAITAILSVVCIVLNGLFGEYEIWIQLGMLGIMLIYWAINFIIFWFTADKKYNKMEVK